MHHRTSMCHRVTGHTIHVHFPPQYFRQVFEIYDTLTDPSMPNMNNVVRGAVNLCSASYFSVGFFGYIALVGKTEVGGEIQAVFTRNLYPYFGV